MAVLRISWKVPLSTWAIAKILLNCFVKLLITLFLALERIHLPLDLHTC